MRYELLSVCRDCTGLQASVISLVLVAKFSTKSELPILMCFIYNSPTIIGGYALEKFDQHREKMLILLFLFIATLQI